jgi:hypothetical protein
LALYFNLAAYQGAKRIGAPDQHVGSAALFIRQGEFSGGRRAGETAFEGCGAGSHLIGSAGLASGGAAGLAGLSGGARI